MLCLDTMIMIWGVQRVARPGQERQVELATRFLDSLNAERVMIPSVVLAEFLAGFEDNRERAAYGSLLSRRFFVAPFDAPSASVAAEISRHAPSSAVKDPLARRCLKADAQIIATAIVHGADTIVTANVAEYLRLASDRIKIVDLPEIPVQPNLELPLPLDSN
jgi:predicted nucleic acid-binding protein